MWVEPTDLPRLAERHDFLLLVGEAEQLLPYLAPLKARIIAPSADKKSLSVEEIRQLVAENVSRHLERQYYVLTEATTLTEAAANAALKLLEEPQSNAGFIWLTTAPERLLPTIRSRAHLFRVRLPEVPPDAALLAEAEQLLRGTPLAKLQTIKRYEKDRLAAERLLTAAGQLGINQKIARTARLLTENVYPRLALLNML